MMTERALLTQTLPQRHTAADVRLTRHSHRLWSGGRRQRGVRCAGQQHEQGPQGCAGLEGALRHGGGRLLEGGLPGMARQQERGAPQPRVLRSPAAGQPHSLHSQLKAQNPVQRSRAFHATQNWGPDMQDNPDLPKRAD